MKIKVDVTSAQAVVNAITRLEELTDSSEVPNFESLVEMKTTLEVALEQSTLLRAHYRCTSCGYKWVDIGMAEPQACTKCRAIGLEPFYFGPLDSTAEGPDVALLKDLIMLAQENATEPLWTARDVANFLKVSEASVVKSYFYMPNFPKGFRLPSKKGLGSRRWRPDDIRTWCDKQKTS